MNHLKIRLVRSRIGCTVRQLATLNGLGLKTRNQVRELIDTPAIRGMMKKVEHLIEEITEKVA